MSHITLPRLFMRSCGGKSEGKPEPSVPKLLLLYVVPLSLLPPLMYVYSQLVHPGIILPRLEPALGTTEALLVGAAFFMVELLAVALMAMFIQQMGEAVNMVPSYAEAYALAATAPTPLWLATLGLILPSLWVNLGFLVLAWFACVGLIRRGVQTLFMPYDDSRTHKLANTLTLIGAATWFALLLFLVLLLSIMIGWR
jgi:hypothetical protein